MTTTGHAALTTDQVRDCYADAWDEDDLRGKAFDEWLAGYEATARADQMRRDADLLRELVTNVKVSRPWRDDEVNGIVLAAHYLEDSAADRLRSGQPAGGQ